MPQKLTRLKKRTDFLRISAQKCSFVNQGFILQADINPLAKESLGNKPAPRVGFTVSKKVGKAVIRNLVKRRRRVLADNLIRSKKYYGIDYVVIGRRGALDLPFSVMIEDFKKSLRFVSKNIKNE